MAYDEALAERIRDLVADEPEITEKKMFGGLAFLIEGKMAVAASSRGGLMVRTDPAETDALLKRKGASIVEMKGRPMAGWLLIDPKSLRERRQLSAWVNRGVAYARSLPGPKTTGRRRTTRTNRER